jgi:hypothetical protein
MKRSHLIAALAAFAVAALNASMASASDLLGSPSPLAFSVPQVENTVNFGVEPGEQNTFAPFNQTCDVGRPVGVARTAWFTVQGNGAPVTVSTDGSTFDTSMFVYSGSPAGGLVTCSDDGPGTGIFASASFNSVSGTTYAVQAGRFCNADFVTACAPAPPAGGTLSMLATTPVVSVNGAGKRAAALQKCKKKTKKGTKARTKCKKRAKKLPL